MIKKDITFEDFEGNTVTETHFFHISKAELAAMAMEEGLDDKLKKLAASKDPKVILPAFKDVISRAYGIRDPINPSRFTKSPEISAAFMSSLAFDELFMELLTNPASAAMLVNGMVPKGFADEEAVSAAIKQAGLPDPNGLDVNGVWPATGNSSGVTSGPVTAPEPFSDDYSRDQDALTGLKRPHLSDGTYVPWAFREPTQDELAGMDRKRILDVFERKSGNWTPPPSDSSKPE